MGELRKFYSLADVVFVGRSLVDLGPRQHGSDMIEPAALAKPVVVGPVHGQLRRGDERVPLGSGPWSRSASPANWRKRSTGCSLRTRPAREMGRRAQDVVRREQGATERHVELILQHLPNGSLA